MFINTHTMETSISNCIPSQFFSAHLIPCTKNPSLKPNTTQIQASLKNYRTTKLRQNGKLYYGPMVECAKTGGCSVAELETEMKSDESWSFDIEGSCQGEKGIVDLMECLEKEAIMGKDEGKEASDYNRRAQIFDKSSKVFRALKEETKPSSKS